MQATARGNSLLSRCSSDGNKTIEPRAAGKLQARKGGCAILRGEKVTELRVVKSTFGSIY
jgi:hypothetical protein